MKSSARLGLVALVLLSVVSGCAHRPARPEALAQALRRQIVAGLGTAGREGVAPLLERDALAAFYARRAYRPAWLAGGRVDAALSGELLDAVRGAERHGLRPEDYHAERLARELATDSASDPERLARLDLLLSDAFVHLGRQLSRGAVDPGALHPGHVRSGPVPDVLTALERGLREHAVAAALRRLAPPHPEYAALVSALARLLAAGAGGGWPRVPAGPRTTPGARDPGVVALRERLAWPGAAERFGDADPTQLDPPLVEALRVFQRHHGLADDGVLDDATRDALNVPLAKREDQLRANLERWRWAPRDLGRRHVRVNVASFSLQAFASGRPVLTMRVVVGCSGWETPLLDAAITRLVLNPAWNVPSSIAVREILPEVQRDPGYLAAHDLHVFTGTGPDATEVDPQSIDWSEVPVDPFPFHLRQPPGPRNPLGRIKFVSPNRFAVYLHGTPARAALAAPTRALSHGCVRVEDEVELALFALAPGGEWTRERLLEALASDPERRVPLPAPLPVHLLYLTASADAAGTPSFGADPYGWDPPLVAALRGGAPARGPAETPGATQVST